MRANDLSQVENHIARQGAWYGADLGQQGYGQVLEKLLTDHAVESQLVERTELTADDATIGATILGLGITGFLDLQTTKQLLRFPPALPITEYLYQKEKDEGRVFLRPDEIHFHNSNEGLVLVFLHFSAPPDSTLKPDEENIGLLLQSGFRYQYGGYHCRMVLHPVPYKSSSGIASLEAQGFSKISDQHDFMVFDLDTLDGLPFHPFASLRQTKKPQLGLSKAEKKSVVRRVMGK